MTIFRQGDIILRKLSSVKARELGNNISGYRLIKGNIVAFGEATGHNHVFSSDSQVALFCDINSDLQDPTMVTIYSDHATLKHQQYLPIKLPKGSYQVTRERGYDPFHITVPQTDISSSLDNYIKAYIKDYIRYVSD